MSANNRRNAAANVETGDLSPGEYLRAEIERLALDQVGVSKATGVSRQSINNIINGRQPISRAMAGKLGRLTGHGSDYWLRQSFPSDAAARDDTRATANNAPRALPGGILVNHQILRGVKDGLIDIRPFAAQNVQAAAIHLTLGNIIVTAGGDKIDIGHGKGSFAFGVARAMLANGFYPDTISSDIHALCIDGPAFDQVTTLSKFLCMGMPLDAVIAATTVNAATALNRPELGTLKPGSVGDATILSVRQGRFDYVDVTGEHMTGDQRIFSEGVVIAGRWWHPQAGFRQTVAAKAG